MENNNHLSFQQEQSKLYSSTILPYGDPNMFMNRLYQPDTNIQDLGTSPHSSLVLDHNAKYQPRQDNLLYLQNSRPENMITSPEIKYQHRKSVPMITTTPTKQAYRRRNTEGTLPKYEEKEEAKKKNVLERNRQAALKCRQRKKQWIADLQCRVEFLSTDNDQLQHQAEHLREEIINLKTLLLTHKHCKVAQMNQQMSFQQVNYFNPATNTSGLPSPPPGYSQHPAL